MPIRRPPPPGTIAAARWNLSTTSGGSRPAGLDRGLTFGGQGRADLALLWLARGLQLAHQDDPRSSDVTALNIGGWAREVHRLSQSMVQPGEIIAVALDPEGHVLMAGCAGGGIRFWDLAAGSPWGSPRGSPADVRAVALSPDARIGLSGCDDGTARLWDVVTGRAVGQPMVHAAEVRAVAFSTDGRRVLTASDDGSARLWDAATGHPVGEPLAHRGWVQAIAFSPDGRTILTGSSDQVGAALGCSDRTAARPAAGTHRGRQHRRLRARRLDRRNGRRRRQRSPVGCAERESSRHATVASPGGCDRGLPAQRRHARHRLPGRRRPNLGREDGPASLARRYGTRASSAPRRSAPMEAWS